MRDCLIYLKQTTCRLFTQDSDLSPDLIKNCLSLLLKPNTYSTNYKDILAQEKKHVMNCPDRGQTYSLTTSQMCQPHDPYATDLLLW